MNYGILILTFATANGLVLFDDKRRPVISSAQMTGLAFLSLTDCTTAVANIASRLDQQGIDGIVKCVKLSNEAGLPEPVDSSPNGNSRSFHIN
jgi:hypothetical protein